MVAGKLSSIALGFSTLILLGVAKPSSAQTDYTYPPPLPESPAVSDRGVERLAVENETVIYGTWDFTYDSTPDENLFVTRVFVADLAADSTGMTIQADCGRTLFRHVVAPKVYKNKVGSGVPLTEIEVDHWIHFDRENALGRALVRTCEAAALEKGTEWIWP
ncbi:MAG TPA: hypothetical protein V6D29_14870 [Leptolyngbyaceae cyanobacterium]